jgi:hypothetical protein
VQLQASESEGVVVWSLKFDFQPGPTRSVQLGPRTCSGKLATQETHLGIYCLMIHNMNSLVLRPIQVLETVSRLQCHLSNTSSIQSKSLDQGVCMDSSCQCPRYMKYD